MITFYATVDADSVRPYMPAVPILLPASSFARYGLRKPRLPEHVTERAADSGGFVATFKWGDYRYSPAQYVEWLQSWQPQWAATMDYCCEPEVIGTSGLVRERQQRTTDMAWHFWTQYKSHNWAWVPTVQGWDISDYTQHAEELRPLIEEMSAYYRSGPQHSAFRVGIGTLCRRASSQMIREVALTVANILPDIPLHLWGIKLATLQSSIALPAQVVSVDSAAWHGFFGRDMKRARKICKEKGITKRYYAYTIGYQAYIQKVNKALHTTKQEQLL